MGIKGNNKMVELAVLSLVPRPHHVTAADGLHHRYARSRGLGKCLTKNDAKRNFDYIQS